jgi:ketosteroid isomerase-like protein
MRRSMSNRKVIIESIHTLIHSWLEGQLERVLDMIDDNIVMYIPQWRNRIEGKKEFVRALEECRRRSNIRRYDESDFVVDTHDGVSIAYYRFHIEHTIRNEKRSESGIDLLVFQKKEGTWKLVRRSMLCSKSQ